MFVVRQLTTLSKLASTQALEIVPVFEDTLCPSHGPLVSEAFPVLMERNETDLLFHSHLQSIQGVESASFESSL